VRLNIVFLTIATMLFGLAAVITQRESAWLTTFVLMTIVTAIENK